MTSLEQAKVVVAVCSVGRIFRLLMVMFERSALKWLVFEFSQVCIKLRKFSGLCPPTFQPLSKIESSKGAVPVGQTHPRMTSSFSGSTEVWGGVKKGLIGFKLQNPVECSYSGAYWFLKSMRNPAGARLSRLQIEKFCLEH